MSTTPRQYKAQHGRPLPESVSDIALPTDWRISYEDPMEDNTARAGFAMLALETFAQSTGVLDEEPATALGDLLANVRHLCDALGLDYGQLDAMGERHYQAEVTGEDYP